ncbi:tRNA pseudouridine synthase [Hondaea fermentalgiana]|uniref:tRNA pseudouridine synthase n=1 Tax=Hondaea fermentalgiana TaxID=2315210 RepID=A0A2R5GH11_9STRA|nr:tRNA pseudouridine synthase [Hondaea fermentalgiana]|eukprot:GBG30177.1 tRNA pseudouridine synthase [Hondaea fermentalgiana]
MMSIMGAAAGRPVRFLRVQRTETQRGVRALSAWFDENDKHCIGCGIAGGEVSVAPKKRRVAIFHGYVGSNYKGSQFNMQYPGTVEETLMEALYQSGGISGANMRRPYKLGWTRSSRTDKGAHAVGNVVGGDMLLQSENPWLDDPYGLELAKSINAHLPEDVRVFSVQRVTKSFQARTFCKSRTYHYYMPGWIIGMDGSSGDAAKLDSLQEILNKFIGNRAFHNFTKRSFYQYRHGHRRGWRRARSRLAENQGDLRSDVDSKGYGDYEDFERTNVDQQSRKYRVHNRHDADYFYEGSRNRQRGRYNDDDDDDYDDGSDDDDDDDAHVSGANAGTDGDAHASSHENRNKLSSLRWLDTQSSSDQVTSAHYRHVESFKVNAVHLSPEDPPAIRFEITANSFMINQIRHLIGTAICMTRIGAPPVFAEVLMAPPVRIRFPAVPSETLVLAKTAFNPLRPSDHASNRLRFDVVEQQTNEFYRTQVNKVLRSHVNSPALWQSFIGLFDSVYAPNFGPEIIENSLERYREWRSRRNHEVPEFLAKHSRPVATEEQQGSARSSPADDGDFDRDLPRSASSSARF